MDMAAAEVRVEIRSREIPLCSIPSRGKVPDHAYNIRVFIKKHQKQNDE